MDIDIRKEKDKIKAELTQLNAQLQQLDIAIANSQQARNNQVTLILKKQGALELLQSLEVGG